jgi:hypothetical protein
VAKKSKRGKRSLEIDEGPVSALRPLNSEEAFCFYVALDEPTGDKAESLPEFLEKIRSVKLESLAFHVQRKDFRNWAETTLGDFKLARMMARMRPSHDERLRERMCAAVEKRIEELRETPWTIIVGDGVISTLPATTHPISTNRQAK